MCQGQRHSARSAGMLSPDLLALEDSTVCWLSALHPASASSSYHAAFDSPVTSAMIEVTFAARSGERSMC